ncbi:MAG: outer membrane beta-barrel protein [Candidatus Korobacteraceae bacterium]
MQVRKALVAVVLFFIICNCAVTVQAQFYAGVLGGVATLSGDSRSLLGSTSSFSSYDPKNGPALEVLVGKNLSDYFTVQGEYIWNSNTLILTSAAINNAGQQSYQETRSSSQQSVIGDLLIYFRKRGSRLRPFLSVGVGFVHLASSQQQINQLIGAPVLPPQHFSSDMTALHVPVGLDVKLTKGWVFRYTFSETLSSNPISHQLSPPASHNLQNFQNLFGFIKQF